MMWDRIGDDDRPLTHENLTAFPGSGRPRTNSVLQVLEQLDSLRRYRSRVREQWACDCYPPA